MHRLCLVARVMNMVLWMIPLAVAFLFAVVRLDGELIFQVHGKACI